MTWRLFISIYKNNPYFFYFSKDFFIFVPEYTNLK